jgi:hypothetical protein
MHPLPYIKEGPRRRGAHNNVPRSSLLPPLVRRSPPPLSLSSLSCGSPKGCEGVESSPPLHAIVLQCFWIRSDAIYLYNLGWIGNSGGRLDHHTCVSTRRCCPLWHRSRCAEFFTTLRSATSATSSMLVRECNSRARSGMLLKL